jgi:hypothetical protein
MDVLSFLKFLYVQRVKGFSVPEGPHFENAEATEFFTKVLNQSASYFEWGSGGSTIVAASQNKRFVSVDSDKFFLSSVKRKIEESNPSFDSKSSLVHSDIGFTYYWGYPLQLFNSLSPGRRMRYLRYSEYPRLFCNDRKIDLFLVDGRFRVACAVNAVLYAIEHGLSATILVDDFVGRDHYKILEDAIEVPVCVGRLAVFRDFSNSKVSHLREVLERYSMDPR